MDNLHSDIQKEYERLIELHLQCISNVILNNENINKDITLVGIIDGFNSILAKQAGLDDNTFNEEREFCDEILNVMDKKNPVDMKYIVIVLKLCSEVLMKSMITNSISNKNK